MTTWMQELRHALRALMTRPGFTLVVVLTLALGIGANTAMFSVLHAVLLAPLPYENADQLVYVYETRRDNPARPYWNAMSGPAVQDLRETLTTTQAFAALYRYQQITADLTDGERPERVKVLPVSEGYFKAIGEAPMIGRTFRRDEELSPLRQDEENGNARAAISQQIFESYFGGEASALLSTLTIDGMPHTVVGVMREGYEDPFQGRIDIFIPELDLDGGREAISRPSPACDPASR